MNRLCLILLHNYYFYALFFIVCFLNRLFGCSIITSIVTIRDLHRLSNPCSCLLDSTLWTSCLFVSSVFQSPERCTHNNGIKHYFCDDRVIYYIKAWTHRLVLLSTLNVVNKRRIRTRDAWHLHWRNQPRKYAQPILDLTIMVAIDELEQDGYPPEHEAFQATLTGIR